MASRRSPPVSPRAVPKWVVLARTARVPLDADAGDPSIHLLLPPSVSALAVPQKNYPGPTRDGADRHPYVLAANAAGLLLHMAARGPSVGSDLAASCPPGVLHVVRDFAHGPQAEDTGGSDGWIFGTADRLPAHGDAHAAAAAIANIKSVGLAPVPEARGGGYVVAALRVDHAGPALLSFRSDADAWVRKSVACSRDAGWDWAWPVHDVAFSPHDGKLRWVSLDLEHGILGGDPLADDDPVVLRYVRFPDAMDFAGPDVVPPPEHLKHVRLVSVSHPKVRCVGVILPRDKPEHAAKVSVWTLVPDDEDHDDRLSWEPRCEMELETLWGDDAYYRCKDLPEEVPDLAFLHPENPNVVYLFLAEYMFGVDVARQKLAVTGGFIEGGNHRLEKLAPPVSSRQVLAWTLPSSVQDADREVGDCITAPNLMMRTSGCFQGTPMKRMYEKASSEYDSWDYSSYESLETANGFEAMDNIPDYVNWSLDGPASEVAEGFDYCIGYKRFWDAVKGMQLDCSPIYGPEKVIFTTAVDGTFRFNISYTEPSGALHQVSVIIDGREGWNYAFGNRNGFFEFYHNYPAYIIHPDRLMIDIDPDYSVEGVAPFGHENTLLGLPAVQESCKILSEFDGSSPISPQTQVACGVIIHYTCESWKFYLAHSWNSLSISTGNVWTLGYCDPLLSPYLKKWSKLSEAELHYLIYKLCQPEMNVEPRLPPLQGILSIEDVIDTVAVLLINRVPGPEKSFERTWNWTPVEEKSLYSRDHHYPISFDFLKKWPYHPKVAASRPSNRVIDPTKVGEFADKVRFPGTISRSIKKNPALVLPQTPRSIIKPSSAAALEMLRWLKK